MCVSKQQIYINKINFFKLVYKRAHRFIYLLDAWTRKRNFLPIIRECAIHRDSILLTRCFAVKRIYATPKTLRSTNRSMIKKVRWTDHRKKIKRSRSPQHSNYKHVKICYINFIILLYVKSIVCGVWLHKYIISFFNRSPPLRRCQNLFLCSIVSFLWLFFFVTKINI